MSRPEMRACAHCSRSGQMHEQRSIDQEFPGQHRDLVVDQRSRRERLGVCYGAIAAVTAAPATSEPDATKKN